jgi:hypothetical protein
VSQSNPFFDILSRAQAPADLRKPAVDVLEEFCKGIEQFWSGKLECGLVPGYPTNYGQEYRVVIKSVRSGYEHTLLRAYIPATGRQMKLDFYDYEMTECPDAGALKDALELFLAKPETRDAINAYGQR